LIKDRQAESLAGVLEFSRLTVGDPTVVMGLELNIIAAVVIGGGSILGTLIGVFIMTFLRNGCTIRGVTLNRLRHGQK
jgi:ribose transport system permease protein